MSHNVLSGEQALTDYFTALLDDSEESLVATEKELEPVQENNEQDPEDISHAEQFVPQLKPETKNNEPAGSLAFLPQPDLKDVERLLGQLESVNPVTEIEHVEEMIEENTEKVVSEYHEHLLEEHVDSEIEVEIPEIQQPVLIEETAEEIQETVESADEVSTDVSSDVQQAGGSGNLWGQWESVKRTVDFQVLYFDVNGVTFAVPLDELGGIHMIGELNHLLGRPKWYLGLQTNKDNQLDVVDTACWVMADKLADDCYKEHYHHIVMLGESLWGLACGELKGTALLSSDQVRWREQVGKRPWLAGMVKEKMCALINVEALIAMLNAGLDVKALDK